MIVWGTMKNWSGWCSACLPNVKSVDPCTASRAHAGRRKARTKNAPFAKCMSYATLFLNYVGFYVCTEGYKGCDASPIWQFLSWVLSSCSEFLFRTVFLSKLPTVSGSTTIFLPTVEGYKGSYCNNERVRLFVLMSQPSWHAYNPCVAIVVIRPTPPSNSFARTF
jgi:hypothetical protein